jgi:two-component system cell cycle sensor histidine kinase/response regulator CckA
VLEECGYTVLEAESGAQALALIDERDDSPTIDLVLTDVVMPGMNGREVFERLIPHFPNVRVLYMTGYTDDIVLRNGVVSADVVLLQKPFSHLELGQAVRRVLDAA